MHDNCHAFFFFCIILSFLHIIIMVYAMKKFDFKKFVLSLAIVSIPVLISMILTKNYYYEYQELIKPFFAPKEFIFPIVWSIIYFILFLSTYANFDDKKTVLLISLNIFINALWPVLFFRFQLIKVAIYWLALVIVSLLFVLYRLFKRKSKWAWWNLLYLLWSFYALILNISIYFLNK